MYARRTKVGHDPSSPLGDSASAPPQRAVAARGGGKNRLYRLAIRVWACRVKCWGTFRGGTLHERTSHPNLGDEGVSKYDDSGSAPLRQPVPPSTPDTGVRTQSMCTLLPEGDTTQALLIAINVCAVGSDRPALTRLVQLTRVADVSRPSRGASVRPGESRTRPKQRQTTKAEGRSHAPISRPCAACALNQNHSTTPKHASRSLLPCTD